MKKVILLIISIIFLSLPCFAHKNKSYYIEKNNDYELEFLCFSPKDCYNATPTIIKVKDKEFVGFGGYNYFDINSYRHDAVKDEYKVDVAVDRDPSTDYGYYSKCPFDDGIITHLIFSLTYNHSKKIFKAEYKGFISSKEIVEYEKGYISKMYFQHLNVYYDNKPEYVNELNNWLEYFNKDIMKKFGKKNDSSYIVEIMYIIKYYIFSKS